MARRVKCRYCNEFLPKDESILIIEKSAKGIEKKIFLHKECEHEYMELMKYKVQELKWFDEIYQHVRAVLKYNKTQILPQYLVTRLQDLRNGTIMIRGKGRVIKSKEGYTYDIIMDTFLRCADNIGWAFKNRSFENEKNKINYMMSIIDNNINDTYLDFKRREQLKKIQLHNVENSEVKVINRFTKNNNNNKSIKDNGILDFLEDDEI